MNIINQPINQPITLHTVVIDGKHVAYSSETEFLVQVGRGRGPYRTKWTFLGDPAKACLYYRSLNIGNGYKKRLYMPSCSANPTIAKAYS